MKYTTINIQGNLLSEEILQQVERGEATGQQATDFGFEPGTQVRSEIEYAWSRIKLDWKHFSEKAQQLPASDPYGTTTSRRWMEQCLQSLGFQLVRQRSAMIGGNDQGYQISHACGTMDDLPIHIVGFVEPERPEKNTLDIRTSGGTTRLSPHATVQEYLNVTEHLFAIVTNGMVLRLIRDSGRLIKLTYIEFDLKRMLEEDKYSEFTLLYRLLHSSRFPRSKAEADQSLLEQYYQSSIESGNRIRDGLSQAVKESLQALGNGVLNQPQNESLRDAIRNGDLSAGELNHQLLRLIYRLLFLIVMEERDLVYDDNVETEEQKRHRDIYYRHYSLARLRKISSNRYLLETQYTDLWQGLLQTFSFFEPGSRGIKLGIQPLGGELFQSTAIRHISKSLIDNRVLLECIRSLNEFEDAQKNRVLINFRSLDVEELGSIYEGLLELSPVIVHQGNQLEFTYGKGGERSKSGSHYTPEDLVKPLIQHSLEYLIEDRVQAYYKGKISADAAIQGLLHLKVADVACGSGHILLSAARRIAHEVARIESGEQQPNPHSFRKALKQVIRHCIYGVDKNPLAVELCKVALWLESHIPGEPLNFLDHRIKCGDAIVGLAHFEDLERGVPSEAFKPLSVDDKVLASTLRKRNDNERKLADAESKSFGKQITLDTNNDAGQSLRGLRKDMEEFQAMPERTAAEIERKSQAYIKLVGGSNWLRLYTLANMQLAPFFIHKKAENKDGLYTDGEYRRLLYSGAQLIGPRPALATAMAVENQFFHWFIEFPDVFAGGGFDCVLGNPPFLGGQKLSGNFGDAYLECIKMEFAPIGAVDLVTYFFRRIYSLLRPGGFLSLISTNTIAQGKAREDGLDVITQKQGGTINHAVKSMKWPGVAAVEVALVTITKQDWKGPYVLGGKHVDTITPYLDDSEELGNPYPLKQNEGKSFQGSIVLGKGFVLEPEVALTLIRKDERYREALFPYLNGDDLNNNPDQSPSRWVINFWDWPETKARTYSDLFEIVLQKVLIERQGTINEKKAKNQSVSKENIDSVEKYWLHHRAKTESLYKAISKFDRVLACSEVTKHLSFSYIPTNIVISANADVFSISEYSWFSILQSTIHDAWARKYSAHLESRLKYSPGNAFETFPIRASQFDDTKSKLEEIGLKAHNFRVDMMRNSQLGLTKVYNLYHSRGIIASYVDYHDKQVIFLRKHLTQTPDTIGFEEATQGILKLRELHEEMDKAVLEAYDWNDIKLRHNFYEVDYLPENDRTRFTIHPDARREILKRLLLLNHKLRKEEEEEGLWEGKEVFVKPVAKAKVSNRKSQPEGGFL